MKKIKIQKIILVLIPVLFIFSGIQNSKADMYIVQLTDNCTFYGWDCSQDGFNIYLAASLIQESGSPPPTASSVSANLVFNYGIYGYGGNGSVYPVDFTSHTFVNVPQINCNQCINAPSMTDGISTYYFSTATTTLYNVISHANIGWPFMSPTTPLPNISQNYTMRSTASIYVPSTFGGYTFNIEEFMPLFIPGASSISPSIFSK